MPGIGIRSAGNTAFCLDRATLRNRVYSYRKATMGSTQAALGEPFFSSHTLEDQFERLSICGINTCGVDPSPLQSLEAKTKACVLSILKLYLKMLICGIYLEIWAMWSDKQLGISRRWS